MIRAWQQAWHPPPPKTATPLPKSLAIACAVIWATTILPLGAIAQIIVITRDHGKA